MAAKKGTMPPNAGKGRPPGHPNKVTKELRDMVLGALEASGGEAYLQKQADANPGPFLALVGKCLPKDINLKSDLKLKVSLVGRGT